MRTPLSMKREMMKFLRENWVRHYVCPSTGQLRIGSAVFCFDCPLEYVQCSIPVSETLVIRLNVNYGAADFVFRKFSALYSALPGRYNLIPIVVYPKPKLAVRNAQKAAEKPAQQKQAKAA